jgi:dTDP-glucose 4,6-dehydratase
MPPLPKDDLEDIVSRTKDFWSKLRGQNIFITGGTGFFGHWLVESFIEANDSLALGSKAYLLTRNIKNVFERSPHLAKRNDLVWVEGDVLSFKFPIGIFPYVIHAATDTYDKGLKESADHIITTIVEGTRRVLDLAKQSQTHTLLYVSSGAVYGPQSLGCLRLSEEMAVIDDRDITNTPYSIGKVRAEKLCVKFSKETSISVKIVRCFAFVGPHLPLDKHFAVGNFIRDAINNESVKVSGNGESQRTYLYASDLCVYLWSIILNGCSLKPYNVGGHKIIKILELAKIIKYTLNPLVAIDIDPNHSLKIITKYVPDVDLIKNELGLIPKVSLEAAIIKTAAWNRHRYKYINIQ